MDRTFKYDCPVFPWVHNLISVDCERYCQKYTPVMCAGRVKCIRKADDRQN